VKGARHVERRLEQMVEGLAARVFRGRLHPVELGARLVREADLASFEGEAGPTIPNLYVFRVHPRDLGGATVPPALRQELSDILEAEALDRGWRLEGPSEVLIEPDDRLAPGALECHSEVRPGTMPAWAHLKELKGERRIPLRHNRVRIGRSSAMDVTISDPEVSRAHATIWREGETVWITDLGSSNGTFLDRSPVAEPAVVYPGALVSFGPATFSFRPG
jgi:hypothetical protein